MTTFKKERSIEAVSRTTSQNEMGFKSSSLKRNTTKKNVFVLDRKKKTSETAKKMFLQKRNRKDLENYMVARIFELSVYTEATNEYGASTGQETAESEKTFRGIVPFSKDLRVTNMKIKKTWLFNYLKERYS